MATLVKTLVRRLISIGLLAVFAGLGALTPVLPAASRSSCKCACPKGKCLCCCRRARHPGRSGEAAFTSGSSCISRCGCAAAPAAGKAAPGDRPPDSALLAAPVFVLPAGRPSPGVSELFFSASLYQRPPPFLEL